MKLASPSLDVATTFNIPAKGVHIEGEKGPVTIPPPFNEEIGYAPVAVTLLSAHHRDGQVRWLPLCAVIRCACKHLCCIFMYIQCKYVRIYMVCEPAFGGYVHVSLCVVYIHTYIHTYVCSVYVHLFLL